jgi:hypothetical protein
MKIRTIMLLITAIFFILALASLLFGSGTNAIVFGILALVCKPVDQPPGLHVDASS